MRINQMITKRRISDLLSISPNLFCKEMYRDQFGEFVWVNRQLAPVVQKVDNAIKYIGFPNTYPLDSELSNG